MMIGMVNMRVIVCGDQLMDSVAQRRLGYQTQTEVPRMRKPLTTALTRLTRECEQEELHLMRKYACVNALSFMPQQIISAFMNQQNRVVETIVNRIISQSRKNSQDHSRTPSNNTQSSADSHPDQEYIIRRGDLRSFIQKMAMDNYENTLRLEQKEADYQQLRKEVQKCTQQIEQLNLTIQTRDAAYRKRLEEVEGRCGKEKRKREQLELELGWSTNKIKEQLREIQKLKQSMIAKNNPKVNHQEDKGHFLTPGKDGLRKLENLASKNCESIEFSLLNSDVVHRMAEQSGKEHSTEPKDPRQERNFVLNAVENCQPKGKDGQIGTEIKLHRHAQLDQKDRLLKCLGEKCFLLEGHIERLTKKYLGEVVYNQSKEHQACKLEEQTAVKHDISKESLRIIEQQSGSSLHRAESDVELSSAFRAQPQL